MFTGSRRLLDVACFTALLLINCKATDNNPCSSSCGSITNITSPFRLKGDPPSCGNPSYELSCENNHTLILYLYSGKYYVEQIYYNNFLIRLVDPGIQKRDCSSLPLYSLSRYNFSWDNIDPYTLENNEYVTFLKCAGTAEVNLSRYLDTSQCSEKGSSKSSYISNSSETHSYAVYGALDAEEVEDSCTVEMQALVSSPEQPTFENIDRSITNFSAIHDLLAYGFELSWYRSFCKCKYGCYINDNNDIVCSRRRISFKDVCYGLHIWIKRIVVWALEAWFAIKFVCGLPCVFVFLMYKFRKRHQSMYGDIEAFLQSQNNLMPIRYSYSKIKKMTTNFTEKLGEGGYGCVFKGKLRSGHFVAVKMLGKSKANGQEFINEVATIGRIHHVNVVRLVGFCVEGSKRALVYDFMANGSLEKYIFPEVGNISINVEKVFEISMGVARGIDYLHRGCDMQILHFDIKPHNILLDENLRPRVSDFGLAKLYPTDDSIVSLTAARGTMGYMAPELFYKNVGGVSHKADVYSFGMLLMEMAAKRKNLNAFAEHTSQIYFPTWIHEQFNEGKNMDLTDATQEENKIVKKMIIVALWCIQMKPSDRPSMNKVVEMLEGTCEALLLPPKPFLSPQEMLID